MADQEPRTVLLVDDDDDVCLTVRAALEAEGYEVRTEHDGQAGLAAALADRPGMVLLDMRMPVLDGWGFAARYRALPGPHAPVVAFTAAPDAEQRAREIHADACLAKPFELDDLLAIAARFCGAPVPAG